MEIDRLVIYRRLISSLFVEGFKKESSFKHENSVEKFINYDLYDS